MKKLFLFCFIISSIVLSCNDDDSFPVYDGSNQPSYYVNLKLKDSVIYNGVYTEFSIDGNTNFTKAEYYIDSIFIDSTKLPPYKLRYIPSQLSPGTHTIKCRMIFPSFEITREQKIECKLRVGEEFQGGIIFYLEDDELNGLIAAKNDIKNVAWGPKTETGAKNTDGKVNTPKIIDASTNISENVAAYYFKNGYLSGGYSDWYIPSIEELIKLKANKKLIRNFNETEKIPDNFYLSSSENDAEKAFGVSFYSENLRTISVSKEVKVNIRPIRKITYE